MKRKSFSGCEWVEIPGRIAATFSALELPIDLNLHRAKDKYGCYRYLLLAGSVIANCQFCVGELYDNTDTVVRRDFNMLDSGFTLEENPHYKPEQILEGQEKARRKP